VIHHSPGHEDLISDEKAKLLKVLDETHWNRTEAAKKLGMTLRQIRYRIAKYNLED
jgi:two-component system response regulator PilR (NtrC family)